MSNRWLAPLLFVAALSLPSHASADSGITGITQKITDPVQQTVNKTISTETNIDNSWYEASNSAKETESPLTEPAKSDSATIEVKVPLVKVQASLSAESLKVKVAETETEVATDTPAVKVSTPLVNAEASADTSAIKVDSPVVAAEVSTKKPAVKVSTPLVNAKASVDTSAIKVDTPVTVAEVSTKKPAVKVSIPLVNVEVSADTSAIKVDTPVTVAEVSANGKEEQSEEPKTPTLPPIVSGDRDIVLPISPHEHMDENSSVEITTEKAIGNSAFTKEQPTFINRSIVQDELSRDLTNIVNSSEINSFTIFEDKSHVAPGNQPASPVTFSYGQGTCATTTASNSSPAFMCVMATMYLSEHSMTNKAMQESKFYYDEWLNAPPTQPPQKAFFLQNIKYTI